MITILQEPDNIQPVYGNLVYRFHSTNQATTFKFRYIVDVFVGGVPVTRLKITPQLSFGQVDISTIVRNYISSRPINKGCDSSPEEPIVKSQWGALKEDIVGYYIEVGEEYTTNPSEPVQIFDPSVTTDENLAYNGVKNWYDGKQFDFSPYYLNNMNLPTSFPANDHKFLTHAPRVQYITDNDWHTLAGFNSNSGEFYTGNTSTTVSQPVFAGVFEFFDIDGNFISSARTYNILDNCGAYLDCKDVTTKTLNVDRHYFEYFGTGTKNITDEHSINLPTNWHYYRVYFEGTQVVCRNITFTNNDLVNSVDLDVILCDGSLSTQAITPGGSITLCARGFGLLIPSISVSYGDFCTTFGVLDDCITTTRISEYFYFYKDPECGPGKKRVMFLNSMGTWDYFTFKYRDNVGYDIQRETLQREPDLYSQGWNADRYYGWNNTNRVYKQNISKTGLLYSGRISKNYLTWLTDELLKSPSVYFVDDDGDIQPIVLTNTEVIEPNFQRNDGEYELRLEYSGGYNETRQDKE